MKYSLAALQFCHFCDNGHATMAHQFKHVRDGYQTVFFTHGGFGKLFRPTRKGRNLAHELARQREAEGRPAFHSQVKG